MFKNKLLGRVTEHIIDWSVDEAKLLAYGGDYSDLGVKTMEWNDGCVRTCQLTRNNGEKSPILNGDWSLDEKIEFKTCQYYKIEHESGDNGTYIEKFI